MEFNFLDELKNFKEKNIVLNSIVDGLEELKDIIERKLKEINISKNEINEKGELYYVYLYTPQNVYITKQRSDKIEILKGVSDEFKRNLAEGYILRYKNGKYLVDEMLTEKSMKFELDFDNYRE